MQAGMSFLLLEIHGRPERGSSPQTPSTAELEMSEWLLILRVLENYVLVELEISLGSMTRCESREKYLKAIIFHSYDDTSIILFFRSSINYLSS